MEIFSLLNYDKQKGSHGAAVKSFMGSSETNSCRNVGKTKVHKSQSGRTLGSAPGWPFSKL
jgi:hypothetical protein